jgi:hypothetical protein
MAVSVAVINHDTEIFNIGFLELKKNNLNSLK